MLNVLTHRATALANERMVPRSKSLMIGRVVVPPDEEQQESKDGGGNQREERQGRGRYS